MRYNCPHCQTNVSLKIDLDVVQKAHVRCGACQGIALLRKKSAGAAQSAQSATASAQNSASPIPTPPPFDVTRITAPPNPNEGIPSFLAQNVPSEAGFETRAPAKPKLVSGIIRSKNNRSALQSSLIGTALVAALLSSVYLYAEHRKSEARALARAKRRTTMFFSQKEASRSPAVAEGRRAAAIDAESAPVRYPTMNTNSLPPSGQTNAGRVD